MTLKELLEKTSRFQKVDVFCKDDYEGGKASYLLENLGISWLESPVLEVKAELSELLIEVGD